MEEREGGSLHFTMGPEMGSDGHVTRWDPPHRLVYEEDWAALMGKDPATLSQLTSEFLVEAQSGGTCVVRVTSNRPARVALLAARRTPPAIDISGAASDVARGSPPSRRSRVATAAYRARDPC